MPIGRDAKGPGGQGHPFKCMWSEAWWQATLGPTDPSSGESEFIALVGGSSEALYIADCLRFLVESENLSVEVRARSDSAACRGITQRVGCGRIRHLDTSLRWVQSAVKARKLSIGIVPGHSNPTDIGTSLWQAPDCAR